MCYFTTLNLDTWKMFTIYRFVSEGALRSTIFDMIKRFESGKSAKHHVGGSNQKELK